MTNPEEIVSNLERYFFLAGECEKIIDTRKRLPEFVFRRRFPKYFAIEYTHVYGDKEFLALLSNMSNICEDNFIHYMALDPSLGDDHFPQGWLYGIVSFQRSRLAERYRAVMHPKSGRPAILIEANLGVFWGSSLKWGIFADRISWELAVIAVPENIDVPNISGLQCRDAEWVAGYMECQYHWKRSVADDFNQRFPQNYPL